MSHLKQRKEKQCLNCNAIVYGHFCHICGQENVEPKEPFLHLLRHFIEDVTHFDGKFFETLKYLLLRPGFLSYEYMRGRRNSYLNPIRMYIFTSAIFFLIYFNTKEVHGKNGKAHTAPTLIDIGDSIKHNFKTNIQGSHAIDSLQAVAEMLTDSIKKTTDSSKREALKSELKVLHHLQDIGLAFTDGEEEDDEDEEEISTSKNDTSHHSASTIKNKNRGSDIGHFFNNIKKRREELTHKIPQVMFITLPLMALMLQMLYGRLKQFYYVNHIIFVIHLYIAVYLLILMEKGFIYLHSQTQVGLFSFLASITSMGTFFYTYKSMRNFYLQGRVKTMIKCFMLYFLFFIIAVLSFIVVAIMPFSLSH